MRGYVEFNEGLRLELYECTANKVSVGYGRNLTDRGISEDEADLMLKNDLKAAEFALYSVFGFELFLRLSGNRRVVLMDMMHNLGLKQFSSFEKMIAAVKAEDHLKASHEILDSKYARKDVPRRVQRNAFFMEKG